MLIDNLNQLAHFLIDRKRYTQNFRYGYNGGTVSEYMPLKASLYVLQGLIDKGELCISNLELQTRVDTPGPGQPLAMHFTITRDTGGYYNIVYIQGTAAFLRSPKQWRPSTNSGVPSAAQVSSLYIKERRPDSRRWGNRR